VSSGIKSRQRPTARKSLAKLAAARLFEDHTGPPVIELSAILSAVKPRERTDQYKILAAMYSLGAYTSPVTARQVREALVRQLGKRNAPQNVSSSLRAYSACIDPAGDGPPLLWSLTPKGLERLRSLSGLALAAPSKASDFSTDVGFVCALENPEATALINALGGPAKWTDVGDPRFPHVYRQTELALTGER
jgi:hypothetical protein